MHANKKILALMATSAVAVGALAGPISGASAKTIKFTATTKSTDEGKLSDVRANVSSKPFGKGKGKGYIILPKGFFTWKFKNCTLVGTNVTPALDGSKVKGGTWKLTKGKSKGSKCKGATGSGTYTGDIAAPGDKAGSKGVFKFKGTIKTK